jgi:hypothetical protein
MARRNGVSLSGPRRDRSEEVYRAALGLFREKGYHATVHAGHRGGGRLGAAQIGGYFADLVLSGLIGPSASSRKPARPASRRMHE